MYVMYSGSDVHTAAVPSAKHGGPKQVNSFVYNMKLVRAI